MDRITSLSVFVAAVEEGSFAAAAKRYGMSAAMAGKHVSAIEAELDVRLLQRSTRRLSLTDAGQRYFERCKHILDAFDEANREATNTQTTPRGLLRVATPVTFGAMYLGEIFGRYLHDHPYVNVEVLLEDRYVDLLDARVDVAIRIGRLEEPGLVTRKLASCGMVICASPAFLAEHGIPQTPDDLLKFPRLSFSEAVSTGNWTVFDADNHAHIIEGPCRMVANNMQILLSVTLTGAGIAYGPAFVFASHIRQGELVKLLPDYHTQDLLIQAVYPGALRIPMKVRGFVDYLANSLSTLSPWDRF